LSSGLAALPAAAAPEPVAPEPVAPLAIPPFGPVGHNGPITVAHRGNSGERPENTLRAIETAINIGVDYVEVDLRQTKDPDGSGPDTPSTILMHDADFFRTTNVNNKFPVREHDAVDTFTRGESLQLDAGLWNDPAYADTVVPSLAQALDAVAGSNTGLLFEFKGIGKYPGFLNRTVGVIRDWAVAHPGHPLAVASTDPADVRALKAEAPGMPRGLLGQNPSQLTNAQLADMGTYAHFMGVSNDIISAENVQRVKAAGMKVLHNTSTRGAMVTSEANGADGTMTDYPRRKRETVTGKQVVTIEAESLTSTARTSASVRSRPTFGMAGGKLSGLGTNTWMQLWENVVGGWMALDLDVPSAGTYEIKMVVVKDCSGGIYDVRLDTVPVLTGHNGFRPGCHRVARETVSLGQHNLSAGIHTLRFTATGKSAGSDGYRISPDVFELHRV
ncbi:MAG: glycerophosphodiester phosphodiesterase family protein, partial [Micromonosporaceae bacterium]